MDRLNQPIADEVDLMPIEDDVLIGLLLLAILAAVLIAINGIRIIRPYEQAVYIRLGNVRKGA